MLTFHSNGSQPAATIGHSLAVLEIRSLYGRCDVEHSKEFQEPRMLAKQLTALACRLAMANSFVHAAVGQVLKPKGQTCMSVADNLAASVAPDLGLSLHINLEWWRTHAAACCRAKWVRASKFHTRLPPWLTSVNATFLSLSNYETLLMHRLGLYLNRNRMTTP